MRGVAALVLIVAALTACGGDGATATTTTTTSAAATTTTARPSTTSASPSTTAPATTTTVPPTTTTSAPAAPTYEFTVVAGSVDGPDRIEATVGEEIVITVSADVTDEVHLHGYDLFADVAPGAPARLDVVTDIPGIFEMELEGARLVVTELEVR